MNLSGGSDGKECRRPGLDSWVRKIPGEVNGWTFSMDRGAWQATVHAVTESQIRLKDQHIKTFSASPKGVSGNCTGVSRMCQGKLLSREGKTAGLSQGRVTLLLNEVQNLVSL